MHYRRGCEKMQTIKNKLVMVALLWYDMSLIICVNKLKTYPGGFDE